MTKPLLVGLSERYGYDALGFIVAPPGKTITTATPIRLDDADKEHVERLRRLLIERLFYVNRWGGEVTMYSKPMSVGVHSILVALLAAARARKAGLDEEAIAEHEATGAIHDIGEALGLGDVPGPLLDAHPAIEVVRQEHQRMASALFPAAAPFTVGARIVAIIDKGIRVWERLWFYPESYAIDVDGNNPVALQAFGAIVRSLPVKDWIEGRRIDEAVDLLLSLALGNGAVLTAGGSIESSQPIAAVVGDVPTHPTVPSAHEAPSREVLNEFLAESIHVLGKLRLRLRDSTATLTLCEETIARLLSKATSIDYKAKLEKEGAAMPQPIAVDDALWHPRDLLNRFCKDFDFDACECEDVTGGVRWRVTGMLRALNSPALPGDGPADVAVTLYKTGKATTLGKETPQRAAVRRWLEGQGFNVRC